MSLQCLKGAVSNNRLWKISAVKSESHHLAGECLDRNCDCVPSGRQLLSNEAGCCLKAVFLCEGTDSKAAMCHDVTKTQDS